MGLKTMSWVCGTLLPKKTRFSKKTSKNLIGCHLSRSFSLFFRGFDFTLHCCKQPLVVVVVVVYKR